MFALHVYFLSCVYSLLVFYPHDFPCTCTSRNWLPLHLKIQLHACTHSTCTCTCALISLPMSRSSLTVDVWPFIAANIRGVMPNLLPVLKWDRQNSIQCNAPYWTPYGYQYMYICTLYILYIHVAWCCPWTERLHYLIFLIDTCDVMIHVHTSIHCCLQSKAAIGQTECCLNGDMCGPVVTSVTVTEPSTHLELMSAPALNNILMIFT